MEDNTIYLELADGTCFAGKSFGAPVTEDVLGEVVFTTAMTGYLETLTDPSYYGQMVIQTFPLVGNYGVIPTDFESSHIHMSAYIVREWCDAPSNFRCKTDLDSFLKSEGVPGIYDLDTRALTKKIRECGVMNGRLTKVMPASCSLADTPEAETGSDSVHSLLHNFSIQNAVASVSTKERYTLSNALPRYHVVLWDFGAKANIAKRLVSLGCSVTVVPANSSCDDILSLSPDGLMLSNGPGNPKENESIISELKKLCSHNIPTFGICLGHQLLALANGADTEKLKYGHRGSNQPVKDGNTGRIYITSQNHGYAVVSDTIPANATERFINVNDGTCEGISYQSFPGFSVQFHPEACGGPKDTDFLFHEFISLMERSKESCH